MTLDLATLKKDEQGKVNNDFGFASVAPAPSSQSVNQTIDNQVQKEEQIQGPPASVSQSSTEAPPPGPGAQMWNNLENVPIAGTIPSALEETWHHPLLAIPRMAAGFAGGVGEGLEMPATLGTAAIQTGQGMAGVPEQERFKIPSADAAMRQFAQPLLRGGQDTRPHHGGEALYDIGSVAGQMVGSIPYGGIVTRAGGVVLAQLAERYPVVAQALKVISDHAGAHPMAANMAKEAATGAAYDPAFESMQRQQEGKGLGASPAGLITGAGLGAAAGLAGHALKTGAPAPEGALKAEEAEFAPQQVGKDKFALEAAKGRQFTDIQEALKVLDNAKSSDADKDAAQAFMQKAFAEKAATPAKPQLQPEQAQTTASLKGGIEENVPAEETQAPEQVSSEKAIPTKYDFMKRMDIPIDQVKEWDPETKDYKPFDPTNHDVRTGVINQDGEDIKYLVEPTNIDTNGNATKVDAHLIAGRKSTSELLGRHQKGTGNIQRYRQEGPLEGSQLEAQEGAKKRIGTGEMPLAQEEMTRNIEQKRAQLEKEVPELASSPDLGNKLAEFVSREEGSGPTGYPLEIATNVAKEVYKGGKETLKTVNDFLGFRKDSDIIKQHEGKYEELNGLEHRLYQQIAKEHLARLEGNVHFDTVQYEEASKLLKSPKFKEEDILKPENSPHLTDSQRQFVANQKGIRQETVGMLNTARKFLKQKKDAPEELIDAVDRWKDAQFGSGNKTPAFDKLLENITANIYQSQFSGNIGNELLQMTDPLIFGTSRVGPVTMAKAYWTVLFDPKVRNYLGKLGLKGDMAVRRQAWLEKQTGTFKAWNRPLEVKVGKHTLSTTGSPSEALNSAVLFTAGVIDAGQKASKKAIFKDLLKKSGSQYLHDYIDWVETGNVKGNFSAEEAIDATVHGIKAVEDVVGGATLNMDKDPMQRSAMLRALAPFSRQQIRVARLFSKYARAGDIKSLSILTGMIVASGGSAILPKELQAVGLDKRFPLTYIAAKEFLDTLNAPRYAGLDLSQKIQMATYNIGETLPTEEFRSFTQKWGHFLDKGIDLKKPEDQIRAVGMIADLMMLTGTTPGGIGAGQIKRTVRTGIDLGRGYSNVEAYSDYEKHVASGIEPMRIGPDGKPAITGKPDYGKAITKIVGPSQATKDYQDWRNREIGLNLLKTSHAYKNMEPEKAQKTARQQVSNLFKTYPTDIATPKRY